MEAYDALASLSLPTPQGTSRDVYVMYVFTYTVISRTYILKINP